MDELKLGGPSGHSRCIKVLTRRCGANKIEVRASLRDERPTGRWFLKRQALIHHMVVRLVVDTDLIIRKAEFVTLKGPYLECAAHVISSERLVGLSLQKGFTKKVMELYGGVQGCSHILSILLNLAPAVRQGFVFTLRFPEEEKRLTPGTIIPTVQKMGHQIINTCQVWQEDSSVQRDLNRGELRDLPKRLYPQFWRKNKKFFKK